MTMLKTIPCCKLVQKILVASYKSIISIGEKRFNKFIFYFPAMQITIWKGDVVVKCKF